MSTIVTVSRLKAWNRCPRLHDYSYNQCRRPIERSLPLRFGSAWHDGFLEPRWSMRKHLPHDIQALNSAAEYQRLSAYECEALSIMATAYHLRYADDFIKYQVLAVEQEFLIDLETDYGTVRVAGKIDALLRRLSDDTAWVVESKSSSESLDPESPYWTRLRLDPQISTYLLAAQTMTEYPVAGVLYDVARKPGDPKLATPEASRKYTKGLGCKLCSGKGERRGKAGTGKTSLPHEWDGDTCKRCNLDATDVQSGMTEADGRCDGPCAACKGTGWEDAPRLDARQREKDEDLEAYSARIAEEIGSNPDAYLRRQEVQRLASELDEGANDTAVSARLLTGALQIGHHPKNTSACHLYGRACDYLPVCRGEASIDDNSRYQDSSAHEELPSLKGAA